MTGLNPTTHEHKLVEEEKYLSSAPHVTPCDSFDVVFRFATVVTFMLPQPLKNNNTQTRLKMMFVRKIVFIFGAGFSGVFLRQFSRKLFENKMRFVDLRQSKSQFFIMSSKSKNLTILLSKRKLCKVSANTCQILFC